MTNKASSSHIPASPEHQTRLSLLLESLGCATRGCLVIFSGQDDAAGAALHLPKDAKNEDLIRFSKRVKKENKGVLLYLGDETETSFPVQLGSPISQGTTTHVYCFEIVAKNRQQASKLMFQLECNLRLLQKSDERAHADIKTGTENIERLSELVETTGQCAGLSQAAQHVTDRLCDELGLLRVSLGQYRKNSIHLVAISHQSAAEKNSQLGRDICHAMEECSDQGKAVRYPGKNERPGPVNLLHKSLCENHGVTLALSLPITADERDTTFVLLIECGGEKNFGPEAEFFCTKASKLIGPVLTTKMVQEQGLLAGLMSRWEHSRKRQQDKKYATLFKVAPVFLAVFLMIIVKGEFRVPADVQLTGTILRSIVAPFPGYIASSEQSAGDRVEAGQVLATLDTSDLTLEELTWSSKYAQADLEYRKAIAQNSTSQAKIITQQKKQAEIQLSLLQLQKERATIKAPFTGTIVSGDLSQAVGGPVERGKLLFEMVPEGGYRILAQVDEGDISYLEQGQQGSLVFNSLPGETFHFSLTKITPVSTAAEGKNSFRVEAKLLDGGSRLRPGMQGYGKIRVGSRPLVWLWTRTLRERLQMLFWRLLP